MEQKEYLSRLVEFIDRPGLKIVKGVRYGGKTALLDRFREELVTLGVAAENILRVDFDGTESVTRAELTALHSRLTDSLNVGREIFLLLDELPGATEFELAVGSLYLNRKLHIYIAASWQGLTKRELVTALSGGYDEISVYPAEEAEQVGDEAAPGRLYTMLFKDVLRHNALRDVNFLLDILRYVCRYGHEVLTYKRLMNELNFRGGKPSQKTVTEYLTALKTGGLIAELPRYYLAREQRLVAGSNRWYATSLWLRRAVLGQEEENAVGWWENRLFCEFKRRGYEIFSGRIYNDDVTFVSPAEPAFYVQVTTVERITNAERILKSVHDDNAAQYILATEEVPPRCSRGVKIMGVRRFWAEHIKGM